MNKKNCIKVGFSEKVNDIWKNIYDILGAGRLMQKLLLTFGSFDNLLEMLKKENRDSPFPEENDCTCLSRFILDLISSQNERILKLEIMTSKPTDCPLMRHWDAIFRNIEEINKIKIINSSRCYLY